MAQSQASVSTSSSSGGPSLVITTADGTTTDRSQIISGTFSDVTGATPAGSLVAIQDDGVSVGTAVVAADGTWSSEILLYDLGANHLTATATDAAGRVGTSAPVVITLDTVLSPPSGGVRSGGATSSALATVIHPARDAAVSGTGGSDTFVFTAHPGHTVIDSFSTNAVGGDRLSFSSRSFASLADVLRHTTLSGGDAVIHLTPHDTVRLVGVSKAELRADPSAFAFHA